jgi:hypothetical protein
MYQDDTELDTPLPQAVSAKPNGKAPIDDSDVFADTPNPTTKTGRTNRFSVSSTVAQKAKKGETASTGTSKGRQATIDLGKPPKNVFVTVHPDRAYRQANVPVYYDEANEKYHLINPELYESGNLPDRFQRACRIMDVYTAALADGSFLLWQIYQSASKWCNAAQKAVQAAMNGWVLVEALKSRSTYLITPAEFAIPAPKWDKLPEFDVMLMDAFASTIYRADDEVINKYLSGGYNEEAEE